MEAEEAPGAVQQSVDSVGASSNLSRRIQNRLQKLNDVAQSAGGDGDAAGYYDFSTLDMKPDHEARPVWVCPNGRIFLEAFSPIYKQAYDFLVAISEPVSRPEFLHEYKLTPYSLYAAVSVAIETESILKVLERLSKNRLPEGIVAFIKDCTLSYGKAKLVLHHNEFYVESLYPEVLRKLLEHEHIRAARVKETAEDVAANAATAPPVAPGGTRAEDASEFIQKDVTAEDQANLQYQKLLNEDYNVAEEHHPGKATGDQQKTVRTVSFKIRKTMVEQVKRACLDLDYPLMEEYDFRNDKTIPDLEMDLKPTTRIREYQEKSLSKMFGNGRARSGIIVLPCGAGKTLTGVTAASTIKKSCLCLCTSAVSVEQWTAQFKMWTNIPEKKIARFTSVAKDYIDPESGVIVTTYTMVAFGGRRARASEEVMQLIQGREWGCILLDEVHVVPAKMFRKVIGSIACHCKLGLTATLVREDDLIGDLNFLIGPKLYEANWMDLTQSGFLANVSCVEVWCPMTGEFYREYLRETKSARKRALLYVANPNKFTAAEFLIQYHEERGDKILLFSDDVFALRLYATKLNKGYIYGGTGERERMRLLQSFRSSPLVNVICISKVGDTSIDLPEANVIIQVSSHFGSRRQEAQRLGRILRPKANATGGFNAFFYTLISTDTHEMFYSNKRQQYLVDQGYTFKVVTDLFEPGSFQGVFTRKEDQRALLNEVLSADVESAAKDENAAIRDDEDLKRLELSGHGRKKKKLSSLGALSGADGTKYMEYSAGHGAKQRHNLFRDRCLYKTGKCVNERALKTSGAAHNLCDEHRNRQNQHQRKLDAKNRLHKRERRASAGGPKAPKSERFAPYAAPRQALAASVDASGGAETAEPTTVVVEDAPPSAQTPVLASTGSGVMFLPNGPQPPQVAYPFVMQDFDGIVVPLPSYLEGQERVEFRSRIYQKVLDFISEECILRFGARVEPGAEDASAAPVVQSNSSGPEAEPQTSSETAASSSEARGSEGGKAASEQSRTTGISSKKVH
ncbi:unnamed protein product [Phytophthora lilii]|uniref:DNA 3'-5' helicase n=1 Tax=Phytophthora lilii TaxID=2077276 RepID=A0A9W6U1Z7_9STRA|nr:unnamed protein product [Phytophthora lilii]